MSVRIRGLCKTVFLHRQLEAEWGGGWLQFGAAQHGGAFVADQRFRSVSVALSRQCSIFVHVNHQRACGL